MDQVVVKAAADLDAQILRATAKLILERQVAVIRAAFERFGMAAPVDESSFERLQDPATALAAAHDAAHRHDDGVARAHQELAEIDKHILARVARRHALVAGEPSLEASHQIVQIDGDLAALCDVTGQARTMLVEADDGTHASTVERCTAALERATHGIVADAVAAHVEQAERALVDAVAAMREISRIGVKYFGDEVAAGYIPDVRIAALIGGAQ